MGGSLRRERQAGQRATRHVALTARAVANPPGSIPAWLQTRTSSRTHPFYRPLRVIAFYNDGRYMAPLTLLRMNAHLLVIIAAALTIVRRPDAAAALRAAEAA